MSDSFQIEWNILLLITSQTNFRWFLIDRELQVRSYFGQLESFQPLFSVMVLYFFCWKSSTSIFRYGSVLLLLKVFNLHFQLWFCTSSVESFQPPFSIMVLYFFLPLFSVMVLYLILLFPQIIFPVSSIVLHFFLYFQWASISTNSFPFPSLLSSLLPLFSVSVHSHK